MQSKLPQLQSLLEKSPSDPFLLYGIALEHKKLGDNAKAIEFLDRTIAVDPNYCYAYFQRGQIFEITGDVESARRSYTDGVAAAVCAKDAHAQSELQGALDTLG